MAAVAKVQQSVAAASMAGASARPTGTDSATTTARAQERYYSSYGNTAPLTPLSEPAEHGGVDWAAIGIVVGATCLLGGAVVALVKRTRRRTGRVRVVA